MPFEIHNPLEDFIHSMAIWVLIVRRLVSLLCWADLELSELCLISFVIYEADKWDKYSINSWATTRLQLEPEIGFGFKDYALRIIESFECKKWA